MWETINYGARLCPNCQRGRLKNWSELSADEKMLVERLEKNTDYTKEERTRHLFCGECWFETEEFETFA